MSVWRPRLMLAMAAVALLFAACSGSGSDGRDAFGFLPIPTRAPAPTSTPITKHDRYDICPDLPRELCFLPGDTVSVYQTFSLDQAVALQVFHDDGFDWILGEDVERLVRVLDRAVTLEPWSISQRPFFAITVTMPYIGDLRFEVEPFTLDLVIDVGANRMGLSPTGIAQAPIPAGFVEQVLASFSSVAPTPLPRPTRVLYTPRPPDPTPTPVIVQGEAPFFDHPEERLSWDGPDDKVYSRTRQHCAAPEVLTDEFGIPDLIAVEDGNGYWAIGAVPPPPALRWTGYYHDGWEIWQGENPKTIYLLNTGLDSIVFEYLNYGCI